MLKNDLLEGAVRFHGHFGPFLILGLKAGLLGISYLGKDYFELCAKVETAPHPPHSCFIDGIQFSSGCTTGKGNIEVKAGEGVSVEFVRGEKSINLIVRNDVLTALDHIPLESQAEITAREILHRTDDELFLIRRK